MRDISLAKLGWARLDEASLPLMNELMTRLSGVLERHLTRQPVLGAGVYIARGAVVIGDVTLGAESSVWYHAVVRGDIQRIEIGACSNIQDLAVVHLAEDLPCLIGSYVTVGHGAILHACRVGDESLIGMGATILDGAVIGAQCLVGARALVTPNTVVPDGSLVLGAPAKVVRELSPEERAGLKVWAEKYVANARYCLENAIEVGTAVDTNEARPRLRQVS